MAGIDEVLERVVGEPGFRAQLVKDPGAALAGYELSRADFEVLASELSTDAGGDGPVEQRTSRAALMSVFTQIFEAAVPAGGVSVADDVETVPLDTTAAYDDDDGDGLVNVLELMIGTDATNADTDGDGITDGAEFGFTDPLNPDTDGDGLTDGAEFAFGSDPTDADTDGDGLSDGAEVGQADSWHTDPGNPDTDGDGVKDGLEVQLGTDPLDADSDDDGLTDGEELAFGSDPNAIDTDGDGMSDAVEAVVGTDPLDPDTDDDGLTDGEELAFDILGDSDDTDTDPTNWDTDGDGWGDGIEVMKGTDPLDPDSHPTSLVGHVEHMAGAFAASGDGFDAVTEVTPIESSRATDAFADAGRAVAGEGVSEGPAAPVTPDEPPVTPIEGPAPVDGEPDEPPVTPIEGPAPDGRPEAGDVPDEIAREAPPAPGPEADDVPEEVAREAEPGRAPDTADAVDPDDVTMRVAEIGGADGPTSEDIR